MLITKYKVTTRLGGKKYTSGVTVYSDNDASVDERLDHAWKSARTFNEEKQGRTSVVNVEKVSEKSTAMTARFNFKV